MWPFRRPGSLLRARQDHRCSPLSLGRHRANSRAPRSDVVLACGALGRGWTRSSPPRVGSTEPLPAVGRVGPPLFERQTARAPPADRERLRRVPGANLHVHSVERAALGGCGDVWQRTPAGTWRRRPAPTLSENVRSCRYCTAVFGPGSRCTAQRAPRGAGRSRLPPRVGGRARPGAVRAARASCDDAPAAAGAPRVRHLDSVRQEPWRDRLRSDKVGGDRVARIFEAPGALAAPLESPR